VATSDEGGKQIIQSIDRSMAKFWAMMRRADGAAPAGSFPPSITILSCSWPRQARGDGPPADAERCGPRCGRFDRVVQGDCGHQVEPDRAELAQQYGAHTTALEWRERLVCSQCQSRKIDMAVSGTERRAGPDNPKSGMRAILPQHFGTQRPQCQCPTGLASGCGGTPIPALGGRSTCAQARPESAYSGSPMMARPPSPSYSAVRRSLILR
jgi:hypothetical protein